MRGHCQPPVYLTLKQNKRGRFLWVSPPRFDVAVLIASRNGSPTIAHTIKSCSSQADVFVVSDASSDNTIEVAEACGAQTLALSENIGKPAALRRAFDCFRLKRYKYVAILDDDTTLAPDYFSAIVPRFTEGVAVVSGKVLSHWDEKHPWNIFVAMRAFTYWSYQITVKRGQDALHVVNIICGASSTFRSKVLDQLLTEDTPYAIDDMYWMAELVRKKLGRVCYEPRAESWTIDPYNFKSWYKQTVRWSWGQFQSIYGHRLGARASWFDFTYLLLLLDWLLYLIEPFAIPALLYFQPIYPLDLSTILLFYVGMSAIWLGTAALALKRPRLFLFLPAILILDLFYRITMLHALIKTAREPRVARCVWKSPARLHPSAINKI